MKKIQISTDLYEMMVEYVEGHYDPDDTRRYWTIIHEAEDKQEKLKRHLAYTRYKTSDSEKERENARKEYLDSIGMHESFRW